MKPAGTGTEKIEQFLLLNPWNACSPPPQWYTINCKHSTAGA